MISGAHTEYSIGGRDSDTIYNLSDFKNCAVKIMSVQWKPLVMITLGPALFDNNNRLITLNGRYKNLHYLIQFIVTTFYMYKKQQH